jgi:hypothetical protein
VCPAKTPVQALDDANHQKALHNVTVTDPSTALKWIYPPWTV